MVLLLFDSAYFRDKHFLCIEEGQLLRNLQLLLLQHVLLNVVSGLQQAEAAIDGIRERRGLVRLRVGLLEVGLETHGTDELLQAYGTHVHKGMLPDMCLERLELGGTVVTQLAAEGSLAAVYHQMPIAVQLVLEFTVTYLAVVQKLSLALPGLEAILIVGLFDLLVLQVMAREDVLEQVLNVRVLLLAKVAVLLNFLVHPLHVHLEMAFAEAAEGAVLTAEFLSGVLPHVDAEVGLDGAGIITLGALERLLVGVNP